MACSNCPSAPWRETLNFVYMIRSRNTFVWFFIGFITATGLVLLLRGSTSEPEKLADDFKSHYRIYSLALPDTLMFAGKSISLAEFDVKERFDRELLTNVYWQSQT